MNVSPGCYKFTSFVIDELNHVRQAWSFLKSLVHCCHGYQWDAAIHCSAYSAHGHKTDRKGFPIHVSVSQLWEEEHYANVTEGTLVSVVVSRLAQSVWLY